MGINCDICAPNYYPQGVCDVPCTPRDDPGGHYTCNPITGERQCLDGYTNPETNCVTVESGDSSPSPSEEGTCHFNIYSVLLVHACSSNGV